MGRDMPLQLHNSFVSYYFGASHIGGSLLSVGSEDLGPIHDPSDTECSVLLSLTSRDREILQTLTLRVKLLTTEQVARTWWSSSADPVHNARKRLRALADENLIDPISILAHPELPLTGPVVSWSPKLPTPDFGAVSYRLRSRWEEPFSSVSAVLATRQTANFFGGDPGRHPKAAEQNHDVHLAAVYLHIRLHRPAWTDHWISEQRIKRSRPDAPGEKLPDAMVEDSGRKIAIEFGGAYTKEKVQGFHEFCQRKGLSYELW